MTDTVQANPEDADPDAPVEPPDDYNAPGVLRAAGSFKFGHTPTDLPAKPIWIVTITDLMGLVLTFFVLLFTMSENAVIKTVEPGTELDQTVKQMEQIIGKKEETDSQKEIALNRIDYNQALDLGYLHDLLEGVISRTPALKNANLISDEAGGRLILTLPQELLFERGKDEINAEGKIAVQALTAVLKNIRNGVEIVGHADPSLARAGGITNWNLSLSRSQSVALLMQQEGYTRALPVMGVSSSLYNYLPAELPEEKRLALSRRVDVVINGHDNSLQQRFGIGQ